MTLRVALITLLVGSTAWAIEPKPMKPPPVQPAERGVIDARADAALRRMSDYLSSLRSLEVETITIDEKVTKEGQKIQEVQRSTVMLQRPDKLRVDRLSPRGHALFRYDGKQFSIYNRDQSVYAIAPAPARLDAAIDTARARLHIDAPGGDLLVSDPYHALVDGTVTGRYIGLEPIDGVMAHHLAFTKDNVDWQIWIEDGPEPVPLRYVITSKDIPARPEFTIELRHWQPNAPAPANSFAFTPPSGARRIEFAAPHKAER